jgi:hypothetical protein
LAGTAAPAKKLGARDARAEAAYASDERSESLLPFSLVILDPSIYLAKPGTPFSKR